MYSGVANLPPNKLNGFCPICLGECRVASASAVESSVLCRLCGKFRFAGDATELQLFIAEKYLALAYRISYRLRSIAERSPLVGMQDNPSYPVYTHSDFIRMMQTPDPSVGEKSVLLLSYLATASEYPGHTVQFEPSLDYSVFCARKANEALFHVESLAERRLLSIHKMPNGNPMCTVTAGGWNELDRITQSRADSPEAFIAMWFDPSQNQVEETIRRAVEASGYDAIRIDKVEHVNRIDDEIIARIRQSRFLVADLTGGRAGVYFEAGFMIGLGRPVIWLCRKDQLKDVHFDTRQYNTIDYTDLEELRLRLTYRIEAILGKGPVVPTKET